MWSAFWTYSAMTALLDSTSFKISIGNEWESEGAKSIQCTSSFNGTVYCGRFFFFFSFATRASFHDFFKHVDVADLVVFENSCFVR